MNSFKENIKPESESEDISKLGILYNVHGSHAKRSSDDISEVGIMCNEHSSQVKPKDTVEESSQIEDVEKNSALGGGQRHYQ